MPVGEGLDVFPVADGVEVLEVEPVAAGAASVFPEGASDVTSPFSWERLSVFKVSRTLSFSSQLFLDNKVCRSFIHSAGPSGLLVRARSARPALTLSAPIRRRAFNLDLMVVCIARRHVTT